MRIARVLFGWTGIAAIALAACAASTAQAGKKILRLKFDAAVGEAPSPDAEIMALFGAETGKTLYAWVKELREAADDPQIAGAAMIVEEPAMSMAQLEELTRAIQHFRSKGKKVYAYSDGFSNRSYALACAADHVTLAEHSEVGILGLFAELTYYKGLLDKIGVEADMLHCGAYKSALEPFTRTEPSKEAAENVNWLLDGMYSRWLQLMADGRKQSVEQIKAAVDAAPLNASESLKRKLIDAVGSYDDFRASLKKEYGDDVEVVKRYKAKDALELDMDNPFAIFSMLAEMMNQKTDHTKPGVALIYITGPITTGKNEPGFFGGESNAGSTTLRAAFNQALEDDAVKAIVVRVDSPGGSALASDIMWNAAVRAGKAKPLVVSMGGVAGSGGYYVAIPGETIFAEESTITGSIGVVGGKMVLKGLFNEKLGITTAEFTRGKYSGLMSTMRRWDESERAKITGYMNEVYEQFKGRVTQSRGAKIKGDLESLAGGRVYTGRQALEKGLVDRMGGLFDAIEYAAGKASLKEYEVYTLPKPKDFGEILREAFGKPGEDEYEVSARPVQTILLRAAEPMLRELAPAAIRRVARGLMKLTVLDQERIGAFMPFEIEIR